ncbi:MAG: hypothetical protein R2939_10380 [Kofleriaceae bacterium]
MDRTLLEAIGTPKIEAQVKDLVGRAVAALDQMRGLDDNLYDRFVAAQTATTDATTASLRTLWVETFQGIEALLVHCKELLAARAAPAEAAEAATISDELDVDFGDLEGPSTAASGLDFDFAADDLGDLMAGLAEAKPRSDAERWASVLDQVSEIEYGLTSQLDDAFERVERSLDVGNVNQVLGLLDDTRGAVGAGVHALVTAIYEAFLPGTDPSTVVPGYQTSLSRALMVRRGIAALAARVGPANAILQGDDRTAYEAALAEIRAQVGEFVRSPVWRAMRAADRYQLAVFDDELTTQPLAVARVTSEGLAKYLDSLSSVNQREVLVTHDQRVIDELREAMATARGLADISPPTAREHLERAVRLAHDLRGRTAGLDQLLDGPAPDAAAPQAWLERVLELAGA